MSFSQGWHLFGARLPTEAEWEYACRAGKSTEYWSGDSEKDLAPVDWYKENSGGRTHAIGEKETNPWGLYDVHGNVLEWTLSPWTEDYSGQLDVRHDHLDLASWDLVAAAAAPGGANRVIRGGSFEYTAGRCRSAYRYLDSPEVLQDLELLAPAHVFLESFRDGRLLGPMPSNSARFLEQVVIDRKIRRHIGPSLAGRSSELSAHSTTGLAGPRRTGANPLISLAPSRRSRRALRRCRPPPRLVCGGRIPQSPNIRRIPRSASSTKLSSAGIKKSVKTVDKANPPTTTVPKPR